MTVGTPFKQEHIKNCIGCNKGVAHDGEITFYRISFDIMMFNAAAIKRQHGLEMMVGSAMIASIMGPNEDLAVALGQPIHALVCDGCASKFPLAALHEIHNDRLESAAAEVKS